MFENKTEEIIFKGEVILYIQYDLFRNDIIKTECTMNAIRFDDWQFDGGYWHNEGGYDHDFNSLQITDPTNYSILDLKDYNNPIWVEGSKPINHYKILQFIDGYQNMEEA